MGLFLGSCVQNLKFASLALLPFKAPKFTGSRDNGHIPCSEIFSDSMWRLSTRGRKPNLKSGKNPFVGGQYRMNPDVCTKFHQNRLKIAIIWERGHTDTHTDRDDTGDLSICPMLCYSNGTWLSVSLTNLVQITFISAELSKFDWFQNRGYLGFLQ